MVFCAMGLEQAMEYFHTGDALIHFCVVMMVLLSLYFVALWRAVGRHHSHVWKCVTNLGYEGGGYEEEQVCECDARRKVRFWPPPHG